jgi:hypothetical protein
VAGDLAMSKFDNWGSTFTKILLIVSVIFSAGLIQAAEEGRFNTVKQKLAEGLQVVGGTVTSSDINVYCAMASAGFDFLWIEMQHSPLTYAQVAAMIRACPGPAIPYKRRWTSALLG